MKLKAKRTIKLLEDIFKKDDIVTLEIKKSTEDKLIHPTLYARKWNGDVLLLSSDRVVDKNKLPEGVFKFCDAYISPKGNYEGYTIITQDGKRYNDSMIAGMIGHKPLSYLFEKVK